MRGNVRGIFRLCCLVVVVAVGHVRTTKGRVMVTGYNGPEEDSAMDEEHDHVGIAVKERQGYTPSHSLIAVGIVTADSVAELGAEPGGSTGPGGSIGGKRKR
ncbi:hypothetical protein F5887DRAFT_917866 [Amanita rubescens]|nr:hypothetical protein F5887DRAFT_917866 [Amanita rubescens]